jgi:hypothetical protein
MDNQHMLDVFFISMKEPGSDENWRRLQRIVPTARRIDNIVGLYKVHETCAKLSKTDNFWVVDADAWILPGFDFTWEPSIDKKVNGVSEVDSVIIWPSKNPVNGLEYGYGAVKVFPRQPFIDGNKNWSIDMTSSVARSIISMDTISCETRFNSTPMNAWIGAFRECTKLASMSMVRARVRKTKAKEQDEINAVMQYVSTQDWSNDQKANYRKTQNLLIKEKYKNEISMFNHWDEMDLLNRRLLIWCTTGYDRRNGKNAISGARAGAKFGLQNSDSVEVLNQINDWTWLEQEYNKHVTI